MRQKARNTISSYMVGVMGIPCGMPCRELQQLFPPKKQGNSAAVVNPKQIPLLWFYPQKSSCLSEGSFLQTGATWVPPCSLSNVPVPFQSWNPHWKPALAFVTAWRQMPAETSETDSPIVYTFWGSPSSYRRGE